MLLNIDPYFAKMLGHLTNSREEAPRGLSLHVHPRRKKRRDSFGVSNSSSANKIRSAEDVQRLYPTVYNEVFNAGVLHARALERRRISTLNSWRTVATEQIVDRATASGETPEQVFHEVSAAQAEWQSILDVAAVTGRRRLPGQICARD